MLLLVGPLLGPVAVGYADYSLTVEVDKIVYLPGTKGHALVEVQSSGEEAGEVIIRACLDYGLGERIELPEHRVNTAETTTVEIPFI